MNLYQISAVIVITLLLNVGWNYVFSSNNKTTMDVSNVLSDKDVTDGSKKSNAFLIIFTLVSAFPLLMGLWAVNHWFKEYNIAKQSVHWDVVPGKILSKGVHFQKQVGQSNSQVAGKTYAPEVEYEFNYNGKTIKWNVIDFHNRPSSGDTKKSQAVLDKLPEVDQEVDVYFSAEHRKAVLIPGAAGTSYFGIIIGSFFYMLGLLGIKLIYS